MVGRVPPRPSNVAALAEPRPSNLEIQKPENQEKTKLAPIATTWLHGFWIFADYCVRIRTERPCASRRSIAAMAETTGSAFFTLGRS